MRSSFVAGYLFGIPIRIAPSWFLAVAGSVSLLGWKIYPDILPADSAPVHWSLALATSLIFFASILLHELGHALLARRFGIPVGGITLFLLGGVAQITQEVRRPSRELLIAAAGPLVSILLGVVFLVPALASHKHGPIAVMCSWAGLMNLSVGIFNLLPGFPMDGGRIFRAAVWAITGEFGLATRIAAWSGRLLALTMIVLGGLMIARVGVFARYEEPLGGFWLALLGFYLDGAARQSLMVLRVLEYLGRFRAGELMLRDVPIIDAGDSVLQFLPALLAMRDCEAAFVAEQRTDDPEHTEQTTDPLRMIGMVTRGRAITVPERERGRTTAFDLMLPADGMFPAGPNDDAASLLQRLEAEGLAAVPVVA
ncbi:MAG: M50 family metallopeptidase, partial [Dehalococcoidia bacterium]